MIPLEAKIFAMQYLTILLLGLQSINVNRSDKTSAAITSLLLGINGWFVTGIVATAYSQGAWSSLFFAYIFAGPCGIVSSMLLYPFLKKLFKGEI